MAIVMRFVQQFQSSRKQDFMKLEAQFAQLEQQGLLPKGERMTPLAAKEPCNTLIWQGRFSSLAVAETALAQLAQSPEHETLFDQQKQYFLNSWVEFYELLED